MKKYTPGSGNKFLFDNLGGRLFEVGDYSREGATIRGNTVLLIRAISLIGTDFWELKHIC